MSLRNLKVAPRSALSFGAICLIVILLGVFALSQMATMREESRKVDENSLPSILALADLNQNMMRMRAMALRLAVLDDPQLLQQNMTNLEHLLAELRTLGTHYERLVSSDEERKAYASLQEAQALYLQAQAKVVEHVRQGRRAAAIAELNGEINAHSAAITKSLQDVMEVNRVAAAAASLRSANVYDQSFFWVMGTILGALVATLALAWAFTRSVVTPLAVAVEVAETVARGDLTRQFEVDGKDEPARLLNALKAMQSNLRDTIQNISGSSNQLAAASEELNTVTEESTRGLQQQNQEIEQAAAAVNQMSTAVDEVARNAVATSEASRQSDQTAQLGRQQVLETVDSIGMLARDVTGSSAQVEALAGQVREIGQVLDVIRSVAEQTNLLALNAAIEAARAGEAGRGFAVVADEVRALAHRTQQSTREIEQMIGSVQQGAENAVGAMQTSNRRAHETLELAKAAGAALDEITAAIGQISELNMVIASASEQQAQVSREVDRNLVNIRDLSTQTSAGAEQTNAASQELSRLAVNLNGLVARFTL
ncbi:methyl-accepting chemotaxis protein [Stutzerimonas azotifigens]|uniref:methyl-accepting chemotaxis protein n=1 Tax=Stutzerimonas azotifigens TaxID=291995 RepID=UPI0004821541|nr:methyl-accepting chemotaxis protein [Stutzerimonas azotifigens]